MTPSFQSDALLRSVVGYIRRARRHPCFNNRKEGIMSRYQNTISTDESADSLLDAISNYLTQEGFKQIDPAENIWKKGMGIMLGPQFVRFEVRSGALNLEAWIKFALFPGLYVGEMGIDGMLAFVPKRMLKKRVADIEMLA